MNEYEIVYPIGDVARAIKRQLWLILLIAVVLCGTAVAFSLSRSPTYEATARLLVSQQDGLTSTPAEVEGLQQLTQTIAQGAVSRTTAEAVISEGSLSITSETLLRNLGSEPVPETQFFDVSYRDSNPQRAQQVVNGVGNTYPDRIAEIGGVEANDVAVRVWEPAAIPDKPVEPNIVRNGILALIAGLVLGTALALLLEYLDDSWRSSDEAERVFGVPTFGVVPSFGEHRTRKGR